MTRLVGRAALARGAERRPDDPVDREVEVGVVHHDDRVLAAELEVDVLEVVGGRLRSTVDAGLARAGERDHRDVGMPHEPVADRAAAAVDDVDDARRARRPRRAARRSARRAAGVSVAGLKTTVLPQTSAGAIFQDGIAIGKFHGVITPTTPIGIRTRHLELVAELGRRRLAEEAPALAGHVVAHVDRFLDVAAGLGLHLAHLVRHQVGELVLVLDEELREAEEDLAALRRGDEPPVLVCRLRRLDRAIDVVGAERGNVADQLAVGRARATRRSRRRRRRPTRRRCSSGTCVSVVAMASAYRQTSAS